MLNVSTDLDRRSYLKRAGVLGTATLGGLAGCLGDGGGDDDGITIASTIPESGQFSSLGQDLDRGYELGVEAMNDELDDEVELVVRDDESDPEQVRQQLRRISSNNSVDMIWGSFSSLLVTAGSAYAEGQGLPFLGAFFAFEGPHRNEDYEWTYSPFPKSRDVARSTEGLLELVPEDDRPSRVGIWEPNSGWGEEQADYWEETLGDAGYDIVLRERFEIGNEDFSTLISRSESQDVEVLLSNPTPPGGITSINQMRDANWAPDVLKYVRAADPNAWWSALGEDGAYALMCPGWVPGMTGNGNEDMWNAYTDAYDLGDDELIPVAVGGSYNIAQVATQAIQAADSTGPEAVRDALRSEEFNTVIGDFSFEENGLPAEGELTAPTGQWWEGGQHLAFPDTDSEYSIDFEYPIPSWDER